MLFLSLASSQSPLTSTEPKERLRERKGDSYKKKTTIVPCSILASFDTVDPEGRQMQSTCIQNPSVKNVLLSLILAERQSYFHV